MSFRLTKSIDWNPTRETQDEIMNQKYRTVARWYCYFLNIELQGATCPQIHHSGSWLCY